MVTWVKLVVHPKLQIIKEDQDASASYWHSVLFIKIFGNNWVYDPTREQFGFDYATPLMPEDEFFTKYMCWEQGMDVASRMDDISIAHIMQGIIRDEYDQWVLGMADGDEKFWRNALEHGTMPEVIHKIGEMGAKIKVRVDEATRNGPLEFLRT